MTSTEGSSGTLCLSRWIFLCLLLFIFLLLLPSPLVALDFGVSYLRVQNISVEILMLISPDSHPSVRASRSPYSQLNLSMFIVFMLTKQLAVELLKMPGMCKNSASSSACSDFILSPLAFCRFSFYMQSFFQNVLQQLPVQLFCGLSLSSVLDLFVSVKFISYPLPISTIAPGAWNTHLTLPFCNSTINSNSPQRSEFFFAKSLLITSFLTHYLSRLKTIWHFPIQYRSSHVKSHINSAVVSLVKYSHFQLKLSRPFWFLATSFSVFHK